MENTYEISIPHFYCLEYCEHNKKMFIEIDFRETFIDLDPSLIKHWEPPFEKEVISDEDKKRILINLYNYFIYKRKWGDDVDITISFE